MVDGKGKGVMNENDAILTIRHVVKIASTHYPVTCRWLERWVESEEAE